MPVSSVYAPQRLDLLFPLLLLLLLLLPPPVGFARPWLAPFLPLLLLLELLQYLYGCTSTPVSKQHHELKLFLCFQAFHGFPHHATSKYRGWLLLTLAMTDAMGAMQKAPYLHRFCRRIAACRHRSLNRERLVAPGPALLSCCILAGSPDQEAPGRFFNTSRCTNRTIHTAINSTYY